MYREYVRYVYTICYEYLGNKEESQDLTSKVFASLWERRETLEIQSSVKHYLGKAAKLKIIDFIRSKERADRKLQNATKEFSSFDRKTENELSYRELENRLNQLVKLLPPRCREVFKLSREQGMSVKEIASALSISENTVKTHLANALSHLREHLSDYIIPNRPTG